MKLRITLKDPDGVDEALMQAAQNVADAPEGLLDSIREAIQKQVYTELSGQIEKWVKWEEYVTIEIDTVVGTAVVCPVE